MSRGQSRGQSQVLIETLWNVNLLQQIRICKTLFSLIETLWNVNCYRDRGGIRRLEFNRNIVECKYNRGWNNSTISVWF